MLRDFPAEKESQRARSPLSMLRLDGFQVRHCGPGWGCKKTINQFDGPVASDIAALYIAAILYDIAHEAGLELHKADLLIWKSISLAENFETFPMRAFGPKVQAAARALWPDPRPGRVGLSRYEEDVADVLPPAAPPERRPRFPHQPARGDWNISTDTQSGQCEWPWFRSS